MELVLNAFWFVLALASFGLWWRRGLRCGPGYGARFHGLVALCCVLFILFPAISMTDDLHADLLVMEEANFSRRGLRGCGHHLRAVTSDVDAPPIACDLTTEVLTFRFVVVGHVLDVDGRPYTGFVVCPSAGRAPPSAVQLS